MSKRVRVILGHPSRQSFCAALSTAYATNARTGCRGCNKCAVPPWASVESGRKRR